MAFAVNSVTATISTVFGQKPGSPWSFLGQQGKINEGNSALQVPTELWRHLSKAARPLGRHIEVLPQYIIGNSSV